MGVFTPDCLPVGLTVSRVSRRLGTVNCTHVHTSQCTFVLF